MEKTSISKRVTTIILSSMITLGAVGIAWAGNVYGDDGAHIKVMTTSGELDSLPMTNFEGEKVYLMPADAKIWVSKAGSTADVSSIDLLITQRGKDYGGGSSTSTSDTGGAGGSNAPDYYLYYLGFEYDKQYNPVGMNEAFPSTIYQASFEDMMDGSYIEFYYILDYGTQSAYISGWRQDNVGWWYQNADGSFSKSAWQLIDGKYYYFNEEGYMLSNTTAPDGYQLDSNGVWIQ